MYKLITISDTIRVPPERMNLDVDEAVLKSAADKYEGLLDNRIGVVVAVTSVDNVGDGKIMANDPGVHYKSQFKILIFKPEPQELLHGEVVDNAEFGAFIRVGPLDGLVHISQIMDDFISYNNKTATFYGKESKRSLKEGDLVRARVVSVSFGKTETNKIGLTMRQTGLGAVHWIEAEKKKTIRTETKEVKKEKK
ncbi:MAG TPA: DNA-directed RNA polymerase [archaeon]|nr:DNA-directed RNA polymerase [archaeon]